MTQPEIIEAEAEIVPIGQQSIYISTDPMEQLGEARARAKVLVEVVNEQGLSKRFGNNPKPHVFVEGWQFLASQFGLIPEIEWTKELEDGWEARAALRRLSDGAIISHADAECRKTERNWKDRDSYAVRSMAQTRAVSKVCRIALSSVMVMAGFNATPAEEMDGIHSAPEPPKSQDEPHCPACLQAHGTLVAVSGPHDRKPFWRCTAKPEDCGGQREHQGKTYSWSGWRSSWENSVAEWAGTPIVGDPQTITIDPDTRENRNEYILREVMGMTGITNSPDAGALIKRGLRRALDAGNVDADTVLGGPLSDEPTDEELRLIYANLTLSEADAVATAAAEVRAELEEPFE